MGISLDGIAAMVDQTGSSAQNSKVNKLQNTLDGDLSDASDEELMDVCKDFEQYFVEQVMKEMEKTIPRNEEDEDASMSQLRDYYKDEMIQQLAEEVCDKQNLGLAQQMYEQMKRNYS